MANGDPLKGFDHIIDRLNRIAMDKVITQDLGPLNSLMFPKETRTKLINDMMDTWLMKGFTPSSIMRAVTNRLQDRGPFGMNRDLAPSKTPLPAFKPEPTDLGAPEFDPRGRMNLLQSGGVVKSRV